MTRGKVGPVARPLTDDRQPARGERRSRCRPPTPKAKPINQVQSIYRCTASPAFSIVQPLMHSLNHLTQGARVWRPYCIRCLCVTLSSSNGSTKNIRRLGYVLHENQPPNAEHQQSQVTNYHLRSEPPCFTCRPIAPIIHREQSFTPVGSSSTSQRHNSPPQSCA